MFKDGASKSVIDKIFKDDTPINVKIVNFMKIISL